jgi:hypothetical protein
LQLLQIDIMNLMVHTKRARLIITLFITILLTAGTVGAIFFAKGYRPSLNGGDSRIEGTGLLSASSYPEQSSVYIDDKLTTTTNDTLNIYPGTYDIKIVKEGFISWQKSLKIVKELVSLTNARLFPQIPSLTAYTSSGAINATPSPDGQKIAYIVKNNPNAETIGIYTISTNSNLLGFDKKPLLVAKIPVDELANTDYVWSPDSRQILIYIKDKERITSSHLLDPDRTNTLPTLADVTVRLPFIFSEWEKTLVKAENDARKVLPAFMSDIASSSASNIYFSPDGEKMLYTATKDINLPDHIIPAVDSVNPTTQDRNLKMNKTYVYDTKEDTNYYIDDYTATSSAKLDKKLISITTKDTTSSAKNTQTLNRILEDNISPLNAVSIFKNHYYAYQTSGFVWYPTSRHLISAKNGLIMIREYDNTNQATLYAGPFTQNFAIASPDGHKLFFLTNLNQPNLPDNLYFLDLK